MRATDLRMYALPAAAVRGVLAEYPFAVRGEGAVAVMGGEDEGAFQWLTLNYLLGNLGGGIQARSSCAARGATRAEMRQGANARLALLLLRLFAAEDGGGHRSGRRQRAAGTRAHSRGRGCGARGVRSQTLALFLEMRR